MNHTAKLRFVTFLPGIALVIFIYVLLTLPGKDIPKNNFFELVHFDKWVHAGLFGSLVFAFCFPLRNAFFYRHSLYWLIIALAILYGIAMEYVQQYFTVDRSFDVTDMLADAVGALLGYFFFCLAERKRTKKNKPL